MLFHRNELGLRQIRWHPAHYFRIGIGFLAASTPAFGFHVVSQSRETIDQSTALHPSRCRRYLRRSEGNPTNTKRRRSKSNFSHPFHYYFDYFY